MSPKRWLLVFFSALLVVSGWAVPAGAFPAPSADRQLARESVPALSPQMAWLSENPQNHGTYLIGPAAASYQPLYTGQTQGYYPITDSGADYPALAGWLLEHCQVKHLVLALSLTQPDSHGGSPLSLLSPPTNWQLRDVEKIGALPLYQADHLRDFAAPPPGVQPPPVQDYSALAAQIRDLCGRYGVKLTVLLSPVFQEQWSLYSQEDLRVHYASLAREVDFWDFSLTPASCDSRYFYSSSSFRPALGAMVMARVLETEGVYHPDNFGSVVTAGTCQYYLDWLFEHPPAADPAAYTTDVPILLYHHVAEQVKAGDDETVVSTEAFERQMRQLAEEGYHAVSSQELIDYVYRGTPLPEKPVYITFDDGYYSNYSLARPILERYGMKAAIFSIGVSMGMTRYKDTGRPMVPHFGYEEARELEQAGVADIQSHTYDMHQWAPYETGDQIRSSILPLEGERYADYAAALLADLAVYDQKRTQELGRGFAALAYPGGEYSSWTEALVHQAGIPLTLSTSTDRRNVLVKGLPQSLYALCRWYVTEDTTPEQLRAILQGP